MVFSLFSRKDKGVARRDRAAPSVHESRPAEPVPAAPPAGDSMAARREAARLTEEKINRIESEMISAAAHSAAPPAGPVAAPPPATVPFALVAPPTRPVTDLFDSSTAAALGDPSNAMAIDINASSLPGMLEEAAILYANGQAAPAAAALRQALVDGDLGGFQQLAWLMLLDLHQLTGDKAAFETLALEYAARFESSPPAWLESDSEQSDAERQAGGSVVGLPAKLDAAFASRVEMIERAMERRRETTIDCAPLQTIDADGAARLLALVRRFEKPGAKHSLVVRGAQRLFDVARAAIEPGRRDDNDACWMLALFALRLLGAAEAFEDLGIEYCVTFEVSPPSWEALPATVRSAGRKDPAGARTDASPATVTGSPPAEPNAFVLSGEAGGRMQAEIRDLRAFSAGRSDVVVDCRALRRIEFVAIGELLNETVNLRAAGKQVLFAEPNRLVYALMLVMGIPELAEVRRRRI